MQLSYCPGDQILVTAERAGRRFAVLLDASAEDHTDALWQLSEETFEPIELIGILASNGLSDLPDFAFVVGDGEQVRVFLRGDITVEVVSLVGGVAKAESHHGGDVSTWSEFTVRPAASVRLFAGAECNEASLPLHGGVVRASEATLVWSQVPFDSTAPVPVTGTFPDADPDADGQVHHDPAESGWKADAGFDARGFTPSPPRTSEAETETETDHDDEPPSGLLTESMDDRDGHTISAAEIARLRAARSGAYDAADLDSPARPSARLRLPSGEGVDLDRPVYVGRAPSAHQTNGATLPRLVKISDDDVDISRTHVEVRFEGAAVVVTDLSTNGTVITRPGAAPERLEPRAATVVDDGTTLTLSEATTVGVEIESVEPDGG